MEEVEIFALSELPINPKKVELMIEELNELFRKDLIVESIHREMEKIRVKYIE